MSKKVISAALCLVMVCLLLCGCGKNAADDTIIRVGSLKGPTSMGIVSLMKNNEQAETSQYEFTMEAQADVLLAKMIQGELDIALVPANVAAVLYQKTSGGVKVIDINTLGVLYMVSANTEIASMEDLKGQTIYLTGKGTTPDFVLQYLLEQSGISLNDVTLEYKSEATEVAAVMSEDENAVGLLPQPFVTAACIQNENLSVVMDLTEQWNMTQGENGSKLVTGVTIVRSEFLENHPELVEKFLSAHQESVTFALENVSETASLVAEYGIVEKAPVAEKALPKCNITFITGEDMKNALSGYLEVLYNQDPTSVGGYLPEDDFYL